MYARAPKMEPNIYQQHCFCMFVLFGDGLVEVAFAGFSSKLTTFMGPRATKMASKSAPLKRKCFKPDMWEKCVKDDVFRD